MKISVPQAVACVNDGSPIPKPFFWEAANGSVIVFGFTDSEGGPDAVQKAEAFCKNQPGRRLSAVRFATVAQMQESISYLPPSCPNGGLHLMVVDAVGPQPSLIICVNVDDLRSAKEGQTQVHTEDYELDWNGDSIYRIRRRESGTTLATEIQEIAAQPMTVEPKHGGLVFCIHSGEREFWMKSSDAKHEVDQQRSACKKGFSETLGSLCTTEDAFVKGEWEHSETTVPDRVGRCLIKPYEDGHWLAMEDKSGHETYELLSTEEVCGLRRAGR
jgi:hypothetical protein